MKGSSPFRKAHSQPPSNCYLWVFNPLSSARQGILSVGKGCGGDIQWLVGWRVKGLVRLTGGCA